MKNKLFTTIDGQGSEIAKNQYLFTKLYSWEAPDRDWEPKPRAWYILYSLFFVIIIACAAILEAYIFIITIIAFIFLWFTQAAIPPQVTEHTITTIGLKVFGHVYKWKEIRHFWFSDKGDVRYLNLDIVEYVRKIEKIRRISLIIPEEDTTIIFNYLIENVDYGDRYEIGYNILSKMIHGKLIPLKEFMSEDMLDEEYFEIEVGDAEEDDEVKKDNKKKKTRKSAKK